MMRRLIIAGVVLALIGAACGDDTADSTTTVTTEAPSTTVAGDTTTTAATTAPPDTTMSEVDDTGPYTAEGDLSAAAAALQFYLTCAGYPLAVDGSFGAMTTEAVRTAQADLGYEVTGVPTLAMFAALTLACDEGRSIRYMPASDATQAAGYVEPGHPQDFAYTGAVDEELEIVTAGGDPVMVAVTAPNGTVIQPSALGPLAVLLPSTGQYTLTVSANQPAWFVLSVRRSGGGGDHETTGGPYMGIILDEGIGVADTLTPAQQVIEIVSGILGSPVSDSGDSTDTGCPGVHRTVSWAVPAPPMGVESRLALHFTDGDGQFSSPVFTDWAYWPVFAGEADPGAKGLLYTPEGITVGSTTDEVTAAYPGFEFGYNPLSGDIMGWTGDFEMIVYGDFGEGMFDMTTDFGVLDGHVMGLRTPLNTCPDELAY